MTVAKPVSYTHLDVYKRQKSDMSTPITASGRYDIAESGDMLIGFPGITDFTPFTLKVNKGDIIKLLFDVEKNVTDVLYIGDISQNYAETTINNTCLLYTSRCV